MKDNKKRIEEMAKDLYYIQSMLKFNDPYLLSVKGWSKVSKELLKLGWIKPEENLVVLSREELNKKYVSRDTYDAEIEYRKVLEKRVSRETAEKTFNKIIKELEERKDRINIAYSIAERRGIDMAISEVERIAKYVFNVEIKE